MPEVAVGMMDVEIVKGLEMATVAVPTAFPAKSAILFAAAAKVDAPISAESNPPLMVTVIKF